MLVIADVEWIDGYQAKYLMQLSALRIGESWTLVD